MIMSAFWPKENVELVSSILSRLRDDLYKKETGDFRISTSSEDVGPFQNIESLYPFLLVPFRREYDGLIFKSLKRICDQVGQGRGGYAPFPEYQAWNKPAVDSSAFAVLLFSEARNYLSVPFLAGDPEAQDLQSLVTQRLLDALGYIRDQQNRSDGGWPFVRMEKLPSRTYSTGLVTSVLSMCNAEDFRRAKVEGGKLLHDAVHFLLKSQIQDGQHKGAWGWTSDQEEPNPNITAFAVCCLVDACPAVGSDALKTGIQDAIDSGVKYIANHWDAQPRVETVRIPILAKRAGDTRLLTHDFVFPYYMALAATLQSGERGYADNQIVGKIEKTLIRDYEEKIRRWDDGRNSDPDAVLLGWDLATAAFNLIILYSIMAGIEHCLWVFPCLVDNRETIKHQAGQIQDLSRTLKYATRIGVPVLIALAVLTAIRTGTVLSLLSRVRTLALNIWAWVVTSGLVEELIVAVVVGILTLVATLLWRRFSPSIRSAWLEFRKRS